MKSLAHALLFLCLSACRLSQSPFVETNSEVIVTSTVAIATPPAASAASATATIAGALPTRLLRQIPTLLGSGEAQQRKRHQTVRLGYYACSVRALRIEQRAASRATTIAAKEPGPNPAQGLIFVGAGVVILIASLLIAQDVSSFEAALLIGSAFGLGIAFIVVGLLFVGLFSYLLALYEKRQITRVGKLKK